MLLPPVLADLLARAPRLDLGFTELDPPEAEAAVRSGDADLAVVFRHVLDRRRSRATCCASRSTGTRCSRSSHRPPGGRPRRARGRAWIAGCPRCRTHLLRCAAARGFVPDVRFASDDHVVVQRLVARGLGVALLPAWALAASTQPGVDALPVTGVDDRLVEVLVRPDTRRIPAVAAVLAGLRATGARPPEG